MDNIDLPSIIFIDRRPYRRHILIGCSTPFSAGTKVIYFSHKDIIHYILHTDCLSHLHLLAIFYQLLAFFTTTFDSSSARDFSFAFSA